MTNRLDWNAAAELAGHAPSIHNTQPWRIVARGQAAELWADRSRALESLDPTGRQLLVSCGGALEHLRIALAAQGFGTVVWPLPEPVLKDLLAIVRLTGDDPAEDDVELARWITRRATVRRPFSSQVIPPEVITQLQWEAATAGAWTCVVDDSYDLLSLSALLNRADEAERGDPRYQAELAAWRRASASPDGIPDEAIEAPTARHTTVTLRDFDGATSSFWTNSGDGIPAPIDERPLVVVLGTPSDDIGDCLTAGRALTRVLLRATALGIAASPLNQVIDDPAFRQPLRHQLGLLGQPHMVLRMGYSTPVPHTGRRPVSDYLTVD